MSEPEESNFTSLRLFSHPDHLSFNWPERPANWKIHYMDECASIIAYNAILGGEHSGVSLGLYDKTRHFHCN